MNDKAILLYVSLILTAIVLAIVAAFSYTRQVETNCWDKYQTENSAIEHCEQH